MLVPSGPIDFIFQKHEHLFLSLQSSAGFLELGIAFHNFRPARFFCQEFIKGISLSVKKTVRSLEAGGGN
jgi:hypothetical protein